MHHLNFNQAHRHVVPLSDHAEPILRELLEVILRGSPVEDLATAGRQALAEVARLHALADTLAELAPKDCIPTRRMGPTCRFCREEITEAVAYHCGRWTRPVHPECLETTRGGA